jgi:uncharacterized protein DUF6220
MRSFARRALPVVAFLFVGCGLVQVFLAGLGVFDDPRSFVTHREFGYVIGWFTLVILVLALVAREPKRIVGLSILLLVQFALQSIFVLQRGNLNAVAALHPVNGFLILVVALVIARLSWVVRHAADPAPAPALPQATGDAETVGAASGAR